MTTVTEMTTDTKTNRNTHASSDSLIEWRQDSPPALFKGGESILGLRRYLYPRSTPFLFQIAVYLETRSCRQDGAALRACEWRRRAGGLHGSVRVSGGAGAGLAGNYGVPNNLPPAYPISLSLPTPSRFLASDIIDSANLAPVGAAPRL